MNRPLKIWNTIAVLAVLFVAIGLMANLVSQDHKLDPSPPTPEDRMALRNYENAEGNLRLIRHLRALCKNFECIYDCKSADEKLQAIQNKVRTKWNKTLLDYSDYVHICEKHIR